MRRTGLFVSALFTIGISIAPLACSRGNDDARTATTAQPASVADKGDALTVTGCLTAAPDRNAFVVTADRNALVSGGLHSGSGEVPTYTYELVGGGDLAAHAGRHVTVSGWLDKKRSEEVDLEAKDKTEGRATTSNSGDKVTPAIETKTEMELQIRRLHVDAVKLTGQTCESANK